jgi:hypothetical protein
MYSASALAANTMCRSAIAAAFPLFTAQMFTKVHTVFHKTSMLLINYPAGHQLGFDPRGLRWAWAPAQSISVL